VTTTKQNISISQKLIEGNYEYQRYLMKNKKAVGSISKNPLLVLTCMNPRIDVFRIFQLKPGDAFVIRNAGNVLTEDMLRSVLIAIYEYNVNNIIVLGHIDCAMKNINLNELREKLNQTTLKRIGKYGTNIKFEFIKFFKIFVDEIRNIKNQVNHFIRSNEIPKSTEIIGMVYDINTGWVFNINDFGDDFSYETFQANRNEIFKQKNSNFKDYLKSVSKVVIEKNPEISHEDEIIEKNQNVAKKVITNQSKEENVLEKIENTIEKFQNNLKLSKIQIPEIYIPKIKVHIPTIYKKEKDIKT
jgi:carbonic anhydrase